MIDIFATTTDPQWFFVTQLLPPAWISSVGPAMGGPVGEQTPYHLSVAMAWDVGDLWDSSLTVDGVLTITDLGLDFGKGPTDAIDFSFAQYGGVHADRIYFMENLVIRDASSTIVFSDDFSSGSFATQGWTVTGPASIVTFPPAPPLGGTYRSPPWRFVVLDLKTFEVLSILDPIATNRTSTYTLDAPAQAVLNVPSDNPEVNIPWPTITDDPFLTEGSRTLLGLRRDGESPDVWTPRIHGIIEQLEDTAQSDNAVTQVTAWDPWQYLMSRPVQNLSGKLPGTNGLSFGFDAPT